MQLLHTFSECRGAGPRNRLSKLFSLVEGLRQRKYGLFALCWIAFRVPALKAPAPDHSEHVGLRSIIPVLILCFARICRFPPRRTFCICRVLFFGPRLLPTSARPFPAVRGRSTRAHGSVSKRGVYCEFLVPERCVQGANDIEFPVAQTITDVIRVRDVGGSCLFVQVGLKSCQQPDRSRNERCAK